MELSKYYIDSRGALAIQVIDKYNHKEYDLIIDATMCFKTRDAHKAIFPEILHDRILGFHHIVRNVFDSKGG